MFGHSNFTQSWRQASTVIADNSLHAASDLAPRIIEYAIWAFFAIVEFHMFATSVFDALWVCLSVTV